MTDEQFFEELAKTPRDWYLQNGFIRRKHSKYNVCPILAVAANLGQELPTHRFYPGVWSNVLAVKVGAKFGLSNKTSKQIMRAADNKGVEVEVRKKLLAACGLEEGKL